MQKQPAIFRLSPAHLELRKKQAVILGPWSLRAHLIPKESEEVLSANPVQNRLMNDQGYMEVILRPFYLLHGVILFV